MNKKYVYMKKLELLTEINKSYFQYIIYIIYKFECFYLAKNK